MTTADTTTTELFRGRAILAEHRDAMVEFMAGLPSLKGNRHEAELAIDQLWDRWAYRLVEDKGLTHERAEIALDAGIQFLAKAKGSKCPRVPTELEDEGWHVMLPYTVEYLTFCKVVVGRFLHHRPNDIIGAMTHCSHEGGHPEAGDRTHLRGYCAQCDH